MQSPVTVQTQSYQIDVRIVAQSAARLNMMHLEIFGFSAQLTVPVVAFQNLSMKLTVYFGVKSKSRSLRSQ